MLSFGRTISLLRRPLFGLIRQYNRRTPSASGIHNRGIDKLRHPENFMILHEMERNFSSGRGVTIKQDPGANEFYTVIDEQKAFVQYRESHGKFTILSTQVPPSLEGRGLGKILAKEVLDYVAKNNFELEIQCEFVEHYVNKYEPKYKKYMRK